MYICDWSSDVCSSDLPPPSPPLCSHSICCSSWLGSPSVGTAGKENRTVYFYPQILLRGKRAPSDREAVRGSYGIWDVKGGGEPRSSLGRGHRCRLQRASRAGESSPGPGRGALRGTTLNCCVTINYLSGPPFFHYVEGSIGNSLLRLEGFEELEIRFIVSHDSL